MADEKFGCISSGQTFFGYLKDSELKMKDLPVCQNSLRSGAGLSYACSTPKGTYPL